VKLWDARSGRLLRTLEGHTGKVEIVAFSLNGLFASKSNDHTIRLWSCETWETVAIIPEPTDSGWWIPALAFHPTLPLLAAGSLASIDLWELDIKALLGQRAPLPAHERAVHHTTAKIVLVGDHSVGKSALGYRLIHGRFETQKSTHGQQFWVFPALGQRRADQTDCEAILWDFAGQPDYRLVHALFVDNADLALVLFDAADLRDPLHGVAFWLKQLQAGQIRCPIILVAAQTDRGTCSMTPGELKAFCQKHSIAGPIATSAYTGTGLAELVERMRSLIRWEEKAPTVTTTTFKRIKDYVLGLKEQESDGRIIVSPEELRRRLEATDSDWRFSDAEMLTAVGHLENYGYVKRLRTSRGEQRVLLQPERLNNLASSFVLQARQNPKGLGALEEKRLLTGGYDFPELSDLDKHEREVLLDSAALLFLEHSVCFRETDPLRMEPYLVFPELINLKKPPEEEQATEDGVAHTVSGPTENVFASLVVLLGYTHTFTRTAQWHNNARYEMGDGLVCGFRQEAERDGELDFVLCFGPDVGVPVRTLFQGLFESFLARRNLTVMRYEVVRCANGHLLDRSVLRQRVNEGKGFTFCNDCGERLTLPTKAEPIQLTREVQAEVESQRRVAEHRTRFEQAVFRVRAYVAEQKITPPESFISYAWGVPAHERWVEKRLATDLQKAGINVVLDRWHNAQIGASVARFIERIAQSDRIVMIGTPLYRRKYENKDADSGYVVAAEIDLINNRLLGTESQKQSVLPVLLDGEKIAALPPLLHGRVYADFRDEIAYFTTAFDLILSLYRIVPNDAAVADLRESLLGPEIR
jgi:small GTP-binding protein